MTDRKYGQHGYRDSEKDSGGRPAGSSGPRQPGILPSRTVFRCADCGTYLWRAVWPPRHYDKHNTHDANGNRLGYVVNHRNVHNQRKACWNSKACAARAGKGGAA